MSNSTTPTPTSTTGGNNNPQRTPPHRSSPRSPHSSIQSSTRDSPQQISHEIENDNNLLDTEQSTPLSGHIGSDLGSDNEVIQRKRVKRRIVDSPSQGSSHSRSSSSS